MRRSGWNEEEKEGRGLNTDSLMQREKVRTDRKVAVRAKPSTNDTEKGGAPLHSLKQIVGCSSSSCTTPPDLGDTTTTCCTATSPSRRSPSLRFVAQALRSTRHDAGLVVGRTDDRRGAEDIMERQPRVPCSTSLTSVSSFESASPFAFTSSRLYPNSSAMHRVCNLESKAHEPICIPNI